MSITYRDNNGTTRKVESVVFNGVSVNKFQYDSGDGQKRIVWCRPYVLSIQKNVGVSSIEVRRTASQEPTASNGVLANGAAIYYGDTLTVSAVAQTGYTLNAFTKTYTVANNVAVNVSAAVNQYSLGISQGVGVSSVTVTRISSPNKNANTGPLSNGATIYYGDQLAVSASPSAAYNLNEYTRSYTVQGDVNVSVTAYVKSFTLSVTQGTGVSGITVTRKTSPYKSASTGTLANGSVIYYGDTLSVSAASYYGYTINSYTSSYTVTGNTTVNVTASVSSYTLNISKGSGVSSVIVTRTSSPKQGASIGQLSNGATIYHGDALTVRADTYSGYELNSFTSSYTVSSNVNVNVTAHTTAPMNGPQISGSMSHDSYSNAFYLTLYIYNPNNLTVTAEIEVEDYNSSQVLCADTITLSPNENRTYSVGEVYTTKVDAYVTFRCKGYTTMRDDEIIQGSFNSSGSSSSGSGSGSGSGSTSSGQS